MGTPHTHTTIDHVYDAQSPAGNRRNAPVGRRRLYAPRRSIKYRILRKKSTDFCAKTTKNNIIGHKTKKYIDKIPHICHNNAKENKTMPRFARRSGSVIARTKRAGARRGQQAQTTEKREIMGFEELKKQVRALSVQAYQEKLFAGTSGNLSALDPESGYIVITPSGVAYAQMKPEDILVITMDGQIVEGEGKPSSEWRVHATVYRHRKDIFSVLHTHSPYATGFAVVNKRIPVALIEMIRYIGGEVPVAAFAAPGSEALGLSALQALKNRKSCLLENHGVLAVGATLRDAYESAIYTEDAAKICNFANTVGELRTVPLDAQNSIRMKYGIPPETA
jgi:L-fuculose-phosphate aldolase/L-ribulose-5-phosphate 4-epimerase